MATTTTTATPLSGLLPALSASNAATFGLGLGLAVLAALLTTAIYRLYLHPLRHIPGPKLAAVTWLYEIYYDVVQPGQYIFRLMELHRQYGPILRINPTEVHIADKDFLLQLYDHRRRNRLYEPSLDTASSVAGTTDYELHRRRRQAMVGFFSPKAVRELEPLLQRKRDCLVAAVARHLKTQGSDVPLNLSDLYFAYCWDLIQEYAFAFESDVLAHPAEARQLRYNSNDLLLQVNYTRFFSWLTALLAWLPGGARLVPPGVRDLQQLAVRVRANVDAVLRDTSTPSGGAASSPDSPPQQHRSIFYSLRDDPALPAAEKAPLRLQREGWFLVVAGSDTPGRVLARTHYHLLAQPAILTRLRAELAPLGPHPTLAQLERLPFLNAVLLEGNRLSFGLSRRNSRVAPEDDLVYQDYVIPAGTPVSVATLAVHADASLFPEPFAFRPERWLEPTAAGKERRRYLMSFGAKGPRSCLGVHLAEALLRVAVAALVMRFELELSDTTPVHEVEYRYDFQMPHGDLRGRGVEVLVRADRAGE